MIFLPGFVGSLGFEPRQTESESVVLPLHHDPVEGCNINEYVSISQIAFNKINAIRYAFLQKKNQPLINTQ